MSLLGNMSRPIVSHAEPGAATMSGGSFVRLAAALLVTVSGFQFIPEPLKAEEPSHRDTMAAQVEYVGSVNADAIENPVLDAGRFSGLPLAGPNAWSMALDCGKTPGGDHLADAANSECPPHVVEEVFLLLLDMNICGDGELIVHSLVCRDLGDGWWEFELSGRCRG